MEDTNVKTKRQTLKHRQEVKGMMLGLFEQNESTSRLTWAVHLLLKEMGLNCNRSFVYNAINRHPKCPSLLTMVEVFQSWGIPCAAYEANLETLKQGQLPYIAQMRSGDVVVVLELENNKICYQEYKKGKCEATLR